jgi:hypothetical protein
MTDESSGSGDQDPAGSLERTRLRHHGYTLPQRDPGLAARS